MLDREDMQQLIARLDGSVYRWCAEHGVAEDALDLVAHTYGRDQMSAAAAVEAFRLGFDAAESQGARGTHEKR
jgi:hypothetical protein